MWVLWNKTVFGKNIFAVGGNPEAAKVSGVNVPLTLLKVFAGGVGSIAGVVTGVLIFTVINYGMTYIGVSPYWQYIIKGSIIVFAVALDSMKYANKK